ncbi:ATP-dependent DNA helicase pif1 [Gigaspora margarita]|uniref:ATP-dependent DNA helicase pif1 n=1 Tax=Gigaspora margarita TaxID=4874 RepID=A0A8H3X9S5_GIGMA|nr:ATP-dependent DNA helicase pif1 [Gigaspora margarita]
MEASLNLAITTVECTRCGVIKPLCDFMDYNKNNHVVKRSTCKNCRDKTVQQYKMAKKRAFETEENEEDYEDSNSLDVLEPTELSDYIIKLSDLYSMQFENKENLSKFYFECSVNVSMLDSTTKKIADYLAESIEDADGFTWIYHQCYSGKRALKV